MMNDSKILENVSKRTVVYAVISLFCLIVTILYVLKQDPFTASIYLMGAIIYGMNTKASIELTKHGLSMEDYKDD